ncbi:hypothetical protein KAR28_04335 [Candidatus Parcubacteria bacterium]|nr:hypothetical protein [Candidatus Parcubacteria bacterium]
MCLKPRVKIKYPKNYGLIVADPKPTDYKFGGANGVLDTIYIPEGNWLSYLPENELQHGVYFDTMACVSFSANNCLEIYLNYMLAHNLIPIKALTFLKTNGYINPVTGKVNLSDRFLAKTSGTTREGNYNFRVMDALRFFGSVPEHVWPYPREQKTPVFDWDDYYKPIWREVYDLGLEFKKYFEIYTEVAFADQFEEALKRSPLQINIHAFGKIVNGVYQRTTARLDHAITLVDIDLMQLRYIYDHYLPHIKNMAPDYIFSHFAYKITVANKIINNPMILKKNYLYKLVEGKEGKLGLAVDNNKLVVNTSEAEKFNVFMEALARNDGSMENKIISVGLADWQSCEHFNLKMQKL